MPNPKKFTTGIDLQGQKAVNAADGSAPSDLVTKAQLDAIARGLVWKPDVKVATTTNITLSGTQTIDGTPVAAGDRVLVKNQSTGSQNGIYTAASGAWARATDLDESAEAANGVAVNVQQGTANGDKAFVLTNDGPVVIGTTALTWGQLGGTGSAYNAGSGLDLTGSTFSVKRKTGGGVAVDGDGLFIDLAALGLVRRYSADVPSGSTTATITHNLATKDLLVQVRLTATDELVECDVTFPTVNTVALGFGQAPTPGQYRVVIG